MIHEKKNGKIVEYFTRREAEEKGIQAVYWRDVKETGQWILTDDDYVLQATVKYITESWKSGDSYKSRQRRRVMTGLSTSYPHGKRPLILGDHIRNRNYALVPTPWYEHFDRKYPAVRSLLAKMVLSGNLKLNRSRVYDQRAYDAFIFIANKIFGPESTLNWYNVRLYFGREEVREQLRKDIAAKAIERGISLDKVFDLIEESESIGRSKKDAKILLSIAKEYGAILGVSSLAKLGTNGEATPLLPGDDDGLDEVIGKE